jgi:GR25 family glycosyltransferase involved in LPS biosynthesis
MDQTKIILNLHYYKNAILETTRLNEALFNNKLIISELPDELDIVNKKFYENNIIFIDEIKDDLSNINNLFEKINFYIDNDNYNTALSKNNDFLNKIFEYSFFYFKNCLVKNNLIDNNIDIENNFKNLKNMTNDKIKFIKNIVIVTSNFGNNNENKNDFIGNILNKEYFDWYYFTNSNSKIEGWNIINNNYYEKLGVKLNDNNLKIQFYKTQNINIDLLNKYSYIIWIDPNMIIDNLNFVNDIINLLEKNINSELFIFENYAYNSVNEEQINNLDLNNTIKTKLINQLNSYIENGYTNNKLYESGFLIYKNNDNNKKLMNDWWFESKNDINLTNLSFSYVISKNIIISYILNEGNFTKGKIEGSINKNNLIGHIDNPNIKTIKNNNIIKQLILNNNLDEINNLNIDYKKINYIDGIVWINLHKDIERNKYMKEILNNINIDNYKIVGIDSNNNELLDMFTNVNYERKLDNYEIANTLSHIKAINYLENKKGDYFLICEDNISFNNIILIDKDLQSIISECPKFDILILNKTYSTNTNNTYVKWVNYYKPLNNDYIGSCAAYIISREGINKFIKFAKYADTYFKLDKKNNLDVSDIYIYKYLDTYVYKYNFIATKNIFTITKTDKSFDDKNNLFQLNIILKDFYNHEIKN